MPADDPRRRNLVVVESPPPRAALPADPSRSSRTPRQTSHEQSAHHACCAGPATQRRPQKSTASPPGPGSHSRCSRWEQLRWSRCIPVPSLRFPSSSSASTSLPCPARPGSIPAAGSAPPSYGRTPYPMTCRSGCRSEPWPADRRPGKPRTRGSARAGPPPEPVATKRKNPVAAASSAAAHLESCACMRAPAHTHIVKTTAIVADNLTGRCIINKLTGAPRGRTTRSDSIPS